MGHRNSSDYPLIHMARDAERHITAFVRRFGALQFEDARLIFKEAGYGVAGEARQLRDLGHSERGKRI